MLCVNVYLDNALHKSSISRYSAKSFERCVHLGYGRDHICALPKSLSHVPSSPDDVIGAPASIGLARCGRAVSALSRVPKLPVRYCNKSFEFHCFCRVTTINMHVTKPVAARNVFDHI